MRRPSKTLSLDSDGDLLFGARDSSSSNHSLDGSRSFRRTRRRRSSRNNKARRASYEAPTNTPLKGILRSSSCNILPSQMSQSQKKVSFPGLDQCRWTSQGSSLSLKSQGLKHPTSQAGVEQGNFVWGGGKEKTSSGSKAKTTLRSESLTAISSLVKKEIKLQAPSRPVRRISNEREGVKPKNVFQTSVDDFQASVRSQMVSTNVAAAQLTSTGIVKSKSTGANLHAPKMPSRRGSFDCEDETDTVEPTVSRASVPDFASLRRRLGLPNEYMASKGQRAPSPPMRNKSGRHDKTLKIDKVLEARDVYGFSRRAAGAVKRGTTSPNRGSSPNIFQTQVTDFQSTIIESICSTTSTLDFADHSLAA